MTDSSMQDAAAVVLDVKQDLGRAARIGLLALGMAFVGFFAWAAFAPLDEGVPSAGVVALDTKRKVVQHLSGGIVTQVLVREGDEVQAGQVLVRLDDAVAKANYTDVRQGYFTLLATQGRLLAEQQDKPQVEFAPQLLEAAQRDSQLQLQLLNQTQLFNARRAHLEADIRSLKEGVAGQRALQQSYKSMEQSRRGQLQLLQQELEPLRELVQEGYAPRNRQLELERQQADIHSSLADLQGNALRTTSSIAELQQRIVSRQQEYRKEVETQLADVNRQVLAEGERYRAVSNELDRTEIRAPASGQVVGLAVQTEGAVIHAGQKIMDIVPKGAPVLLEAQVPPHMIDRVHAEMPVDVRFSSFANSPQLVVDGQVVSVSGDLLKDESTGMSYYLARVRLTGEGLKELGRRQLHPGMPVEVIFKGGERSMLVYLLHPLIKRVAASMTEE
ncbi:MAG: HlyD family type I secretion periplasmic adaptor subunit [Comamonas sp.]|nr:HlyD family type I secretion periplasmic adaptor subunit [Comamonas sp.]